MLYPLCSRSRRRRASSKHGTWTTRQRISGRSTGAQSLINAQSSTSVRSTAVSGRVRVLIHRLCSRRQEPNVPAPGDALRKLGVLSWKLNQKSFEDDPKLEAIRSVRGYSYQVTSPDRHVKMLPRLGHACLLACMRRQVTEGAHEARDEASSSTWCYTNPIRR